MDVALANGLFIRTDGSPAARTLLFVHALADSGLAFVPLFDTPLVERFRLVAVDLAGFGASPRQDNVLTIAQHAEAIATLARSLRAAGPMGLVGHSVGSMIAVEAASRLGELFGGLFSIEGNLTADDAYFSGRAAEFDDACAFKQRFLDDLWNLAQTRNILRRFFAAAVSADPVAMWELGRDARRMSTGDAPGRAYQRVRPSLYYWSPANTAETTRRWIAKSDLDQRQLRFSPAAPRANPSRRSDCRRVPELPAPCRRAGRGGRSPSSWPRSRAGRRRP
jgi:pimeloyl-ACP methyl ester carboxylesterase